MKIYKMNSSFANDDSNYSFELYLDSIDILCIKFLTIFGEDEGKTSRYEHDHF